MLRKSRGLMKTNMTFGQWGIKLVTAKTVDELKNVWEAVNKDTNLTTNQKKHLSHYKDARKQQLLTPDGFTNV